MLPSLSALEECVAELIALAESFEEEERLLGKWSSGAEREDVARLLDIRTKVRRKREFEYNAFIVTLYGGLERFVEDLVEDYLLALASIAADYGKIPQKIRDSHVRLSIEMMTRLELPKYRQLTMESLVANLHSCLSPTSADSFRVNTIAFTHHSANVRHGVIAQMFDAAAIEGLSAKLKHDIEFALYLVSAIFPDLAPDRIATLDDKVVFAPLEDLADRRNDVAHGVRGNLVSLKELSSRARYIQAYCQALSRVVETVLYEHRAIHRGRRLGMPLAVYNNEIVCCEFNDVEVCCGDLLIAKTKRSIPAYLGGEILGLQVNNEEVDVVPAGERVKIGMRVGFHAKMNQEFYLVKNG